MLSNNILMHYAVHDSKSNIYIGSLCYILPTKDHDSNISPRIEELLLNHWLDIFEYAHNAILLPIDWCIRKSLSFDECSIYTDQYYAKVYNKKIGQLPPRQLMPTPAHPFIFLHIEKSAGSTIRR